MQCYRDVTVPIIKGFSDALCDEFHILVTSSLHSPQSPPFVAGRHRHPTLLTLSGVYLQMCDSSPPLLQVALFVLLSSCDCGIMYFASNHEGRILRKYKGALFVLYPLFLIIHMSAADLYGFQN